MAHPSDLSIFSRQCDCPEENEPKSHTKVACKKTIYKLSDVSKKLSIIRGALLDKAWQPKIKDNLILCYLSKPKFMMDNRKQVKFTGKLKYLTCHKRGTKKKLSP